MTPAEVVIDVFGGVRATALAVDLAPSTVCRWLKPAKPKGRGGSGGLVPQMHFAAIQAAAHKIGKVVTMEQLIIGKPGIVATVKRRAQPRGLVGVHKWGQRVVADKPLDPLAWMAADLAGER